MWKKIILVILLVVFLCARGSDSWRRRRRRRAPPPCRPRNCVAGSWTSWGACSHQCGTSGTQRRTRPQTSPASCGGSCPYTFGDTRACNRDKCKNGGTPRSSGCSCRPGFRGTCCDGGKRKEISHIFQSVIAGKNKIDQSPKVLLNSSLNKNEMVTKHIRI